MNNVSYNFLTVHLYIQQISELQNTKQFLEQRVHVLEVCVYGNQLGVLIVHVKMHCIADKMRKAGLERG